MTATPSYAKHKHTKKITEVIAQSIVECKMPDYAENTILAVHPSLVIGGKEVHAGEVRYGGKIHYSILAKNMDGGIIATERGIEFSHKAEDVAIASNHKTDIAFKLEKTTVKQDGKAIILSTIITATISIFANEELEYLSGGENIVCNYRPMSTRQIQHCNGIFEIEEEFETEYVGDILMHCEQINCTKVVTGVESLNTSGEINLSIIAKKEGENVILCYERLIPFHAEIACADAVPKLASIASANIQSVNLQATCDEERNKCHIVATFKVAVYGKVFIKDEVTVVDDAFCLNHNSLATKENYSIQEPAYAFSATEKIHGTAIIDKQIDFGCVLYATALHSTEIMAMAQDGEIIAEGLLKSILFYKDSDNITKSATLHLPFTFPIAFDKVKTGQKVRVSCIACGVAVQQKVEGELETEATFKLFITIDNHDEVKYLSKLHIGDTIVQTDSAISVYLPKKGDTLWKIAKQLRQPPELIQQSNAHLNFPLKGQERIVVYRKKGGRT